MSKLSEFMELVKINIGNQRSAVIPIEQIIDKIGDDWERYVEIADLNLNLLIRIHPRDDRLLLITRY